MTKQPQHPVYLKTQNAYGHKVVRKNKRRLKVLCIGMIAISLILALGGVLDIAFPGDWGLADKVWVFLGIAAFGAGFWLFGSMIFAINLAYIKHTYGDDPVSDPASDQ